MPRRQISPERKGIYYLGILLGVVGFLSFASVFLAFAMNFGDFSKFDELVHAMLIRGFGGMALVVAGTFLTRLGRAGVAGSGIMLDPERARQDVEPWSRMTGGMVKDALDEAGISLGKTTTQDDDSLPFDERLRRLHKLREEGILSEQEYEAKKKQILERA